MGANKQLFSKGRRAIQLGMRLETLAQGCIESAESLFEQLV